MENRSIQLGVANKCGGTDNVELGNANCFERRAVHNALSDEVHVTSSASRIYNTTAGLHKKQTPPQLRPEHSVF